MRATLPVFESYKTKILFTGVILYGGIALTRLNQYRRAINDECVYIREGAPLSGLKFMMRTHIRATDECEIPQHAGSGGSAFGCLPHVGT
jgi:hypothetical protein